MASRRASSAAPVREPVDEGLATLTGAEAQLLTAVLDRLAARRKAAAADAPGPGRLYPTDGYTRALLM